MLSLSRQNYYRELFKQTNPTWCSSGELYEAKVRQYLFEQSASPDSLVVLDLGCGSGGVMELFSRQVLVSVGIDSDIKSLSLHRDDASKLVAGNLAVLPFDDAVFDLVISSWVLEHLTDPQLVFSEIARVLKQGGHFVFLTPNRNNLVTILNRLMPKMYQKHLVKLFYSRSATDTFAVVYKSNTIGEIDQYARSAGLKRVSIEHVSDPTYLAFSDLLFRLSVTIERLTPRGNYVHLVGDYVKSLAPSAA